MDALKNFDLNLLRVLVALVEERSPTRAARRLHLAQPTMSGLLARLRTQFGDDILVRVGRDMEPTARALELLDAVRPLLEALSAQVAASTPFDPTRDHRIFRLGLTDAVALAALPNLMQSLSRLAPHCDLVTRVGDFRTLPSMLASGEISTAIGYLRDDLPATARIKVLRRSPWVILRDHNAPAVTGLDDYCSRRHALVSPLGDLSGFADNALHQLGKTRRVSVAVSSFALLLPVLPKSDLITTVPDFVATSLAAIQPLAIDPCPINIPEIANMVAWRATADQDPAERWFRAQLTAAFAAVGVGEPDA